MRKASKQSSAPKLNVVVEEIPLKMRMKIRGGSKSTPDCRASSMQSVTTDAAEDQEGLEEDWQAQEAAGALPRRGIGAALSRTLEYAASEKEKEPEREKEKAWQSSKAKRLESNRQGIVGMLPSEMSWSQTATRCAQVAQRENDRLPHCIGDERIARRRLPRNRTDSLLRSGMHLDQVVRFAAMRVVEEWVHLLRVHVHGAIDMVNTIAGIVHSKLSDRPLSRSRSLATMTFASGFDGSLRLVLDPNPTPPASTPLGAALRRLVPVGGGRCEFVEDIMAALTLEDDYIATSPAHILRPNTAVRTELSQKQMHENNLDVQVSPAYLKMKDGTAMISTADLSQFSNTNGKHRHLGACAALRLSSACGGWSTFSQSSGNRVTSLGFSAQVMLDQPGPGEYKRPTSVMRRCRVGIYPSVGGPRPVGHAVMGSNIDRFEVKFA